MSTRLVEMWTEEVAILQSKYDSLVKVETYSPTTHGKLMKATKELDRAKALLSSLEKWNTSVDAVHGARSDITTHEGGSL